MRDYPRSIVEKGHVEPVPRRIRGVLGGAVVLDTTRALYLWEKPSYPQYAIPLADVDAAAVVDEARSEQLAGWTVGVRGLRAGTVERPSSVRVFGDDAPAELAGAARIEWGALDAWFEEDEEVHVHPRNPYTRVDALRSTRTVRIERDGVVLAESDSPVLVFETGLPTRYYLNPTDVRFDLLEPSETETACPYKGVTSGYWSARVGEHVHRDIAWSYGFPTRELAPIAGLVAFYNERVDVVLDGVTLERPRTHLGSS
jgi:uncharacterized protein (DUF427 family)